MRTVNNAAVVETPYFTFVFDGNAENLWTLTDKESGQITEGIQTSEVIMNIVACSSVWNSHSDRCELLKHLETFLHEKK